MRQFATVGANSQGVIGVTKRADAALVTRLQRLLSGTPSENRPTRNGKPEKLGLRAMEKPEKNHRNPEKNSDASH